MLQLFDTHFTLNSTTLPWGRGGGGFEAEYTNQTSFQIDRDKLTFYQRVLSTIVVRERQDFEDFVVLFCELFDVVIVFFKNNLNNSYLLKRSDNNPF